MEIKNHTIDVNEIVSSLLSGDQEQFKKSFYDIYRDIKKILMGSVDKEDLNDEFLKESIRDRSFKIAMANIINICNDMNLSSKLSLMLLSTMEKSVLKDMILDNMRCVSTFPEFEKLEYKPNNDLVLLLSHLSGNEESDKLIMREAVDRYLGLFMDLTCKSKIDTIKLQMM